jgi:putative SOS response-associated peptidase YedK
MCGRYNRKTPHHRTTGRHATTSRARSQWSPSASTQRAPGSWPGSAGAWCRPGPMTCRSATASSTPAPTRPAASHPFGCLIPADGFYEWQKLDAKHKQPFNIRRRDERPFAFAGLWEHWQKDGGPVLETCTTLTTVANELMKPIHDRMPVILPKDDWARWLEPKTTKTDAEQLLRPYEGKGLVAVPVSTWVNKPQHDDPKCLEPDEGSPQFARRASQPTTKHKGRPVGLPP